MTHVGRSIVTANRQGRTSSAPNEISLRFIDECRSLALPALDIGCAFGVATLPAAAAGATVVAIDIGSDHLHELVASAHEMAVAARIVAVRARFPHEIDFAEQSLGAVHASNLFNFLTGEDIDNGLRLLHSWCAPGARLFVISGSPYAKNVKGFIDEYERRVAAGWRWPGEVTRLAEFSDDPTIAELPDFLHLLDDVVLARAAEEAGFDVEECRLFERRGVPDYIALDGRENVALVARRP